MAKVVFTPNIQRHVLCPEAEAPGRTVREVLENIFSENSQARSYVLDDQSGLRIKLYPEADDERHVARFNAQRVVHSATREKAMGDFCG